MFTCEFSVVKLMQNQQLCGIVLVRGLKTYVTCLYGPEQSKPIAGWRNVHKHSLCDTHMLLRLPPLNCRLLFVFRKS